MPRLSVPPSATVDQRRHLRYPVALQGRRCGLPLWTRNLSASGMQLSCPSANFALLFPPPNLEPLEIELDPPHGGALRIECRVVYTSQHGDEHLIGAEIVAMSPGDRAALEALVESLARRHGRG